ncbi:hypothetical protein DFH05DRAFT_1544458 [Lentinula detonsa]|uniref:Crinkler effector protein N-terminal domain-containing protein n=1 Tax=Lentinula detonsa TaxID=2804962 RepID=A0A9W8NWW8_9AGAR|nr:hypothetical protein DFH05DRAFT_1544458 [Lentinula detonsa]
MTRELNCLVLDSHASIDRIFPVQISETDIVATLKEKIKQKARPVFEHIDAHTLDLWNVSVPVEELSETHLHDLQPAHAPLPPVKRLSRLFPNTPPEEHLHIIIQPPEIATSPNPQPLLELNCLVLGDQRNHIFPIKIAKTKSVGSLKKAVKEKKRPLFNHVPADDLALWRVSEVVDQNLEDNLKKINFLEKESLSPVDELYKVFSNLPVKGRLHIVVGWPIDESQQDDEQEGAVFDPSLQRRRLDSFDFARPTKRARTAKDDEESPSTFLRRLRNKALKAELPTLAALRAFLNTPLEESVKIPISQTQFDGILSERPDDICTREDVSAVFKIGEAGLPSLELMQALRAPRFSRTEVGYTHFWDFNIRDILQVLIPEAECIRDSNYYTGIGKIFPDFSFLIHKRCVFRGEEKGPMSPEDPALQLIENMVWEYDSAPYILGYYADETVVTFVAITHSEDGRIMRHDLETTDLRFTAYRILNLRRMINMSFILPRLAAMVHQASPSFQMLMRPNCYISFPKAKLVMKTYTCADGLDRVRHLSWVYRTLKEANVPNTDSLITFKGGNVFLEPVGRAAPPNTVGQLRECILCVLDALELAHRIPLYHRDIRKENIIQRIDDPSKWFLIDWEHASTMPTLAQPNFARETHSPAIFENNHGQEVDIWGVGYLILDAGGLILPEIRGLGDRICRDSLKLTVLQTRDLVTAVFQEHQGR